MNKIKYDLTLMKYISFFESLTNTGVKDCISIDEQLIFVVDEARGGTDDLEKEVSELEGVNSIEVTDVRRAIG